MPHRTQQLELGPDRGRTAPSDRQETRALDHSHPFRRTAIRERLTRKKPACQADKPHIRPTCRRGYRALRSGHSPVTLTVTGSISPFVNAASAFTITRASRATLRSAKVARIANTAPSRERFVTCARGPKATLVM